MAYPFPYYGQPYQYQDQLNQLRSAPTPYQPRDNGIMWVQGEPAAKSWIVAPGTTVLLMDSEAQRFYLKTADPGGIPTMRTFEYTEVAADRATAPTQAQSFVSVDEFALFKKEVMGKLDELSAPVEVSVSRKKKGESDE